MVTTVEVIKTADGSNTLYHSGFNEQYHSLNGAITESKHVFIQNGFMALKGKDPVNILEIGFGTGLNAWLTAIEASVSISKVKYYAIEKYPLSDVYLKELNYTRFSEVQYAGLFELIHKAHWNRIVPINPWLDLIKIEADLLSFPLSSIGNIDLVYFDAFGPDKQPEMWELPVIGKIYEVMAENGVFVTYSAKGEVRRKLGYAGFTVERLQGPPGKREMLRGIKKISG